MKKTVLIIFTIYSLFTYGQKVNNGVYYDDCGYQIEIKNETLKLIRPDSPGFPGMVLAECTINQIDESFIELNSLSPYDIVQENISIKQFCDSSINKDSIKITFSFAYTNILDISISIGDFKDYGFEYSKNRKDIMLPININTLSISISPQSFMPSTPEGLHYGILFYSSLECKIEKNINHVVITISAIDDSFFERYYVKEEYAKLSKDSITWKGKVFVKKK